MTATSNAAVQRHPSPPLGPVAIAFTLLFCAGLYPVTAFGGKPYFPGPWESTQTIVSFFQLRPAAARLCAFLQFGSAIPLGIFTATAVSRLRFLGVRAAGAYIALFGGFATAFAVISSSMVLWTVTQPGVAQDTALTQALYFLCYGLGGPGYSVPLGLLMAGISVPLLFSRLVPRWIPNHSRVRGKNDRDCLSRGRYRRFSFLYFLGIGSLQYPQAGFDTDNTSITHWVRHSASGRPARWRLKCYNDDMHLRDIQSTARIPWKAISATPAEGAEQPAVPLEEE